MNKKELVAQIAINASLTRAEAGRALDALLKGIEGTLVEGGRVRIAGFGTFGVFERKPRRVRNPRNGDAMEVAAKRVPRFAPGVDLKNVVGRTK